MKKFAIFLLYTLCFSLFSFSESILDQGIELFSQNNIEDATYLFEEVLITEPSEDAYKYLSECYNILEMYDDEVLVLEEALSTELINPSYFSFKLGNSYHLIKEYSSALNSYLNVIELKQDYVTESFLNIANVSVELQLYTSAIDNYTKYLELNPTTIQKRKIIKMIFLLKREQKNKLAKEEADRILKQEAERLAAEEAKRISDNSRLPSSEDSSAQEEARIARLLKEQKLEKDREENAKRLAEERLLYDQEQKSILEDQRKLKIAQEKALTPPDPQIDILETQLKEKQAELDERDQRISEAESRLQAVEKAIEESKAESLRQKSINDTESEAMKVVIVPETEAERLKREAEEEAEIARLAEAARQKVIMDEILASLDKIGENAQGINALSEGAFNDLEGATIDE